jgi:hypothetical protein
MTLDCATEIYIRAPILRHGDLVRELEPKASSARSNASLVAYSPSLFPEFKAIVFICDSSLC